MNERPYSFTTDCNTRAPWCTTAGCADDGFGNLVPLRYEELCAKGFVEGWFDENGRYLRKDLS